MILAPKPIAIKGRVYLIFSLISWSANPKITSSSILFKRVLIREIWLSFVLVEYPWNPSNTINFLFFNILVAFSILL